MCGCESANAGCCAGLRRLVVCHVLHVIRPSTKKWLSYDGKIGTHLSETYLQWMIYCSPAGWIDYLTLRTGYKCIAITQGDHVEAAVSAQDTHARGSSDG